MPELSRLVLPWHCVKERRCLGGKAGQQHIEAALHHSGSYLFGLSKGLHYPLEGVNSLGNASFGTQVCILVGVSNTSAYQGTWLATGNSYVMVSCWTKANTGDE